QPTLSPLALLLGDFLSAPWSFTAFHLWNGEVRCADLLRYKAAVERTGPQAAGPARHYSPHGRPYRSMAFRLRTATPSSHCQPDVVVSRRVRPVNDSTNSSRHTPG